MPLIMSLTTAAAATQILANAMKAIDSLKEQAKGSKDTTLKENISKLYDELLNLKAAVIRVEEENSALIRAVTRPEPHPEIKQVGAVNYYYEGDKGPYCPPCYDDKKKLVALTPTQEWNNGIRRKCLVCQQFFYEKPMILQSVRRKPWGSY
jgi:hypothetical protein